MTELSWFQRPRVRNLRSAVLGALTAAVVIVCLWQAYPALWTFHQQRIAELSRQTLDLYESSLYGELERYSVLPTILARDPAVTGVLERPDDAAVVLMANQALEKINRRIGALDVYVLDSTGLTLAASNWAKEKTFVGNNYSYRPYFLQAVKGAPGRYFAVGTTTFKRGYFLSSAVRLRGRIAGVVVIKIDLSRLAGAWPRTEGQVAYVTDEHGVIVLSSDPGWLYRTTRPLSEAERLAILRERKYADRELRPAEPFMADNLLVSRPVQGHRFVINLATASSAIAAQVWNTVATVLVAVLAIGLVGGGMWFWRRNHLRKLRDQARLAEELERRVAERTFALEESNRRLQHEILERRKAETGLHEAQDELVQAGKLTALGTMSASVSHELNQPLGAISTFTANVRTLLDRSRIDEARGTLDHIADAADRAARIVANLRAFVRRESRTPVVIDLRAALEKALREAEPQLETHGVTVAADLTAIDGPVRGGMTRVGQVFSNVIGNACLAMGDSRDRVLRVEAGNDGDGVCVTFIDSGPGFSDEALGRATEPFFTTRAHAEGLGLGLAICDNIMRSLDGRMELANEEGGGARIRLWFARAEQSEAA